MSRVSTAIELDSYRLAKYAEQVHCFICDEGNALDAELCRFCFAPMALAHQANCLKAPPKMIACIGSSGVGKTVYLGMLLDMISRRASSAMQVLARGAFSLNLQQKTMTALAQCEFPEKTPNEPDRWNWVHCQVQSDKCPRPVELVMPDMAGEALLEEVDHPHTYQVVRLFLTKCQGAVVLIDAHTLSAGTADQDYFTMKLLSYLIELCDDPKKGWHNRPIAIVFSKADQCEQCFDDPESYAARHAAGLARHCRERFRTHRFFAASVAGNCAMRDTQFGRALVPLRVEPRGIVEPFEWLIQQLPKK
ncbi:MAG: GTPase domain-containing protein [Planctomycetia bacterium]|nr:GTPase domain-containing protein [Planctomycetia bacterium]